MLRLVDVVVFSLPPLFPCILLENPYTVSLYKLDNTPQGKSCTYIQTKKRVLTTDLLSLQENGIREHLIKSINACRNPYANSKPIGRAYYANKPGNFEPVSRQISGKCHITPRELPIAYLNRL